MAKTARINKVTEVDFNTGEIVKETTVSTSVSIHEPPYIKMYVDDLSRLLNVPDAQKKLMHLLVGKIDYDGYITLSKRYRIEMCSILGIKDQALRNNLSKLAKTGLIRKAGYGEYQVDPNLFAKGSWASIVKQREAFRMSITYSPDGTRKIMTEAVKR